MGRWIGNGHRLARLTEDDTWRANCCGRQTALVALLPNILSQIYFFSSLSHFDFDFEGEKDSKTATLVYVCIVYVPPLYGTEQASSATAATIERSRGRQFQKRTSGCD